MKIGIITHHYINNFGAFLQTYALQKTVSELFPDAEVKVINYINRRHALVNTLGWFRFYIGRETPGMWLEKTKLPATFERVRKKYLTLTPKAYTVEEVNDMNFDSIIIGSDEVWNYADKKTVDKIKFGLGLKCKNIISYAPSAGMALKACPPPFVLEGIERFSHLSARDSSAFELIESAGKKAVRVLDPTFLTPVECEETEVKKPYLLFYYCQGLDKKTIDNIKAFAAENGLSIYGAGECGRLYDLVTVNLTPFQWAGMFKNASYVITGTFHGAVFAILNRKRFACHMINPARVEKVNSLLDELGLSDRKFTMETDVVSLLKKEIDYDRVYEAVSKKIEESRDYLRQSLENKNE